MTRIGRAHPLIRRGMTLIELLAALALLSLIMGGLATWLSIAAQGGRSLSDRARFESAAEAALQRIFEDLMVGDVDLQEGRRPRNPEAAWRERVTVGDATLRIETRDASGRSVVRVYELDRRRGTLVRRDAYPGSSRTDRILLGNVHDVMVSLDGSDDADDADDASILIVRIEGARANVMQRRYLLP